MLYQFDDFELDTESFQLRRGGKPAHVEPLVFDLLCFLSQNPGRVIGRDEIVDQVWRGRIVSDATIAGCVKAARKALGDSGERQSYIRTVRGRGFQFMGQVDRVGADPVPAPGETPDGAAAPVDAGRQAPSPSLAILPFAVFGEEADLAPVADGLVDTLATVLTRVPLLAIASRAASAAFKGQAIGAAEVGRRLGVSYLLEGSVQAAGDMLRANVQLIETRHGFHLWAQQFESRRDGDATTGLLHAVLARLEPQLVRAIHNDQRGADGAPTGRQLLIQAMSILSLSGWHTDSFTEVAGLLRQAVSLEPDLALAHAYLALILALGQRVGIERSSEAVVREALREADTALRLDGMDSNVVGLAGCAVADVGQPERAVPILKNAIDLNPNNGHAWAALGSAYLILGQVDAAIDHLQRGVDVSPLDGRLSIWYALLALACLMARDLDRALAAARTGCQANDRTHLPRIAEAAIHLARGDQAAAAASLDECYRVKPDLSQNQIDRLLGPDLGAAMAALRSTAKQAR